MAASPETSVETEVATELRTVVANARRGMAPLKAAAGEARARRTRGDAESFIVVVVVGGGVIDDVDVEYAVVRIGRLDVLGDLSLSLQRR